jgi:hypothetical protein
VGSVKLEEIKHSDDLGSVDPELPWSMTYAIVTNRDLADPSMSPATGTSTHTGYQTDDMNVDDH